jgi:hypothetical protein
MCSDNCYGYKKLGCLHRCYMYIFVLLCSDGAAATATGQQHCFHVLRKQLSSFSYGFLLNMM